MSDTTQCGFRLPNRLVARVDRHILRMERQAGGVSFSRSDAVKNLLTKALDEIERAEREERQS